MHLHFLGICGTFMGSLAQLAKALGHQVSGSDSGVYPPMSNQLTAAGIDLIEGYDPSGIPVSTDMVVVGNAMTRGNPSVEYVLERNLPYCSGPQWLNQHVLANRWVCAVAGTHGKTSTASMLAWILEYAGMAPGFLIGGVPGNFDVSARLGDSPFFVIEADEYDTAFFDKRSKFVHYRPRTVIANNLEFDHADIFADLAAIETQFHHLMRLIPSSGLWLMPDNQPALERVVNRGCWSGLQRFGDVSEWRMQALTPDASHIGLFRNQTLVAETQWGLAGEHNVQNACAAVLAARHVGVAPALAVSALAEFHLPRRRMEALVDPATTGGTEVFDDFAHHPTAIRTTLSGARASMRGPGRLIAVIEPRSNTMKLGVHKDSLVPATVDADYVVWLEPQQQGWSLREQLTADRGTCVDTAAEVEHWLQQEILAGDRVVFMSNGGFSGLPHRFAEWLVNNPLSA